MGRTAQRWLAILVLLASTTAACVHAKEVNQETGSTIDTRKNVKALSASERDAYVGAVLALKRTPSRTTPGINRYDEFVKLHLDAFSCSRKWQNAGAAHNSPLFLPWHREVLLKFEQALRDVSGDQQLTIPYWDWTDPASTAAVFSPKFMGPDGDPAAGYAVTTGPFAKGKFALNVVDPIEAQKGLLGSDQITPMPNHLVRHFGALGSKQQGLPSAQDVAVALGVSQYDTAPYDAQSASTVSFRCNLEGWRSAEPPECIPSTADPAGFMNVNQLPGTPHDLHNGVHVYVGGIWVPPSGAVAGGTMIYDTSPNDPVFWLHHANIDRLWALWERDHPGARYSPQSGAANGFNGDDSMWPWHDMTINSLHDTRAHGYVYATT
ncbi:MAG: putative tyrosinase [Acidimicrobiales bacterium]|nr:putative tyrosinase [Acidimicrobiales bacterium]